MSKVYFKPIDSYSKTDEINEAAASLLKIIRDKEELTLNHYILDKNEGRRVFRKGRYTLEYAEKIGLGSRNYEFVEL